MYLKSINDVDYDEEHENAKGLVFHDENDAPNIKKTQQLQSIE